MEILQEDDQYIIKIPMKSVDATTLEKLLRQIRLQELLSKRQGNEDQAIQLANEINSEWWQENQHRFLK
ncbi:hypothetical protein [Larkinella soli]|uniref:hypothetical protein n=1 Tax=Larkinella soli TaxID=1770527 RepID=UPI000FFBA866|nr:hypothetical protein [Larkinella soli]